MEQKSYDELLKILKEINGLPLKDVKQAVDDLRMTFYDWCNFTNQSLHDYDTEKRVNNQLEKQGLANNTIGYEQFLEIMSPHSDFNVNIAKKYRTRLIDMQKKGYTAEEQQSQMEVTGVFEEIEKLWDDIRAKYNPIHETTQISQNTSKLLRYLNPDALAEKIDELERNLAQFKKAESYLGKLKIINGECSEVERILIEAIERSIEKLKGVENSDDLSIDDFMDKFGIDKDNAYKYYEKLFKNMDKTTAPSIMAYEGKAFKMCENGQLEVIDAAKAKGCIVEKFFPKHVLSTERNDLERVTDFITLASGLPDKDIGQEEQDTDKGQGEQNTDIGQSGQGQETLNELDLEELIKMFNGNQEKIEKNEGKIRDIKDRLIASIFEQQKKIAQQEGIIAALEQGKSQKGDQRIEE